MITKKYPVEAQKIASMLSDVMMEALIESRAIIAGGVVSRVFTNRSILEADVDVYFRTPKDLFCALMAIKGTSDIIFDYTDKSIMIKSDETVVQFIVIDYFSDIEKLFEKFDFTCVMGAYLTDTDEFVLHDEFFQHNSQRVLNYNPKTMFPIISALRVDKYRTEGYSISKMQYMRLIISLMSMNLTSWEEAQRQFGKFYGTSLANIITEENKKKDFSMDTLMEALTDFEFQYVSNVNKTTPAIHIPDYLELVVKLTGIKPTAFSFSVVPNKLFTKIDGFWNVIQTDKRQLFSDDVTHVSVNSDLVYKYVVMEDDGSLHSQHTPKFTYKIGEIAEDNRFGLWFSYISGVHSIRNSYGNVNKRVLIECEPVAIKQHASLITDSVILSKARVIRVVGKEEEELLVQQSLKFNFLNESSLDEFPF